MDQAGDRGFPQRKTRLQSVRRLILNSFPAVPFLSPLIGRQRCQPALALKQPRLSRERLRSSTFEIRTVSYSLATKGIALKKSPFSERLFSIPIETKISEKTETSFYRHHRKPTVLEGPLQARGHHRSPYHEQRSRSKGSVRSRNELNVTEVCDDGNNDLRTRDT